MTTIFVYHAYDHEGIFIAEFLRAHDHENRFQFLALTTNEELEHSRDFLKRNRMPPETELPYLVLISPEEDRVVIHGAQFHDWMGRLIDALGQLDPPALVTATRRLLSTHLSPTLLRLLEISMGFAEAEDAGHPPTPTPTPAPPPPPPPSHQQPGKGPVPMATRHTGGRVIRDQAHSELQYVLDADVDEEALVVASVPGTTEGKAINVAAVIAAEGRQRERQQQYNTDEMRKD